MSSLKQVFDRLLNGLALCQIHRDAAGRATDFSYLLVNDAFVRLTGLANAVGRRVSELIPGFQSSDPALIERYGRIASGTEAERFDCFVEALGMWFNVSAFSPAPGYFIAIFDVINERKDAERSLIEKTRQLERVLEGSMQGYWDWNLASNRFSVSPRFETMLGYEPGEMRLDPSNWWAYVWPADLQQAQRSIDAHLKSETPAHEAELRMLTKSGEWHWVLTRGRVVEWDAAGAPVMMSGTHTDIHEKKLAELALLEAAAVFQSTHEGVLITDTQGAILSVNRAFSDITGYGADEMVGQSVSLLASGRHEPDFFRNILKEVVAHGLWRGEMWSRRKSGEIYPQLTTVSAVTGERGEVIRVVAVMTDISQIKATEARLEHMAHHDPLTGLPNRSLLFATVERAIGFARREGRPLALLMLDLDHFKDINDSFGHRAGDELLKSVSTLIRTRLRESDLLCRLGGDEFAVLLPALTHAEEAALVAEDLIAALDCAIEIGASTPLRVSCSIGIVTFPEQGSAPDELLQHADAAMYRAKRAGRNQFQFFSDVLTGQARDRIAMIEALRNAIACGGFELFFQPQVTLRTREVSGAEALLRWRRDAQTVETPDRFIPLAEETGLIIALGEWVLRAACAEGQRWNVAGRRLKIAVNVSAHQLRRDDFVGSVEGALRESGLPGELLELELTESALLSEHADIVRRLQQLRELGVSIAIDDFGTGYSSLAYLRRLPIDTLKVDRQFVRDLEPERGGRPIAAMIVQIAKALGLRVVAEGIETQFQREELLLLECELGQGFLFFRPLECDAFRELIGIGSA
ncbi:EAL and GGDEF domain-containing protein [Niveibacterium terrae]|uniref:sensor domain-containing protein n=1 Tax=Niveibacterium terrae TaxID=3373598 RepID=UPI003A8E5160